MKVFETDNNASKAEVSGEGEAHNQIRQSLRTEKPAESIISANQANESYATIESTKKWVPALLFELALATLPT